MERRLEQLQSQFQQHVNLNDDEIARLADYLNQVKAEIVEVKDSINRFNIQSTQATHDVIGQQRCEKAQRGTRIAKLNSEHQSYIQALQQHHSNIIQQIHDDFEHSLSEVEQYAENQIIDKINAIENNIKKTKYQIEKIKVSFEESKTEPAEDVDNITRIQNCELVSIKNLENALKEKNKDRLANLVKAKKHLASCVQTLEELEQDHTIKMEKLKTQLEIVDSKYDQKLQSDMEQQKRKLDQLRKKVKAAEKGAEDLQKKINEDTAKQQEKLTEMTMNSDQYRFDINSISMKSITRKENKDLQNAILNLEEMRAQLAQKENVLYQERNTNGALKKEINRLRDEALIAQRRSALNLE
ncbi:hypothetical protein TRFO_05705 [Tritrichomonas foetus]|uniref:Uncharacterized protein n=1 Tax=Tritrichomonas foetus TaxID=1144522 RepID=A0A1J4K3U6_9EUKA|nr:hypothetical protein [Tritrichomonas foetus]OHT06055.1 hypothetical protein TRFO_05705 [Tritrichomonas foetus]|eukprot:OHT06055.1 hypothetical protein TRFO_05705 [Tritrichomonas foetus]